MSKVSYKVYFNAVLTDHGGHLFAVGWTSSDGFQPILEHEGETSNYIFRFAETNDAPVRVFKSFHLCTTIKDKPRSINIRVEKEDCQIQVYTLVGVKAGENKPGSWVEINSM